MTIDTLPLLQDHSKLIRYNNKIYKWKIKYDTSGLKNCNVSEDEAHSELVPVLRTVLNKVETCQPLHHIVTETFVVKPSRYPWSLITKHKFQIKLDHSLYKGFEYVLEFHVSRNHSRHYLKDNTNCDIAKKSSAKKTSDSYVNKELVDITEDVPDPDFLDLLSLTYSRKNGTISDSDFKLAANKLISPRGKSPQRGEKRIKKSTYKSNENDQKFATGKKLSDPKTIAESKKLGKSNHVKINKSPDRHSNSEHGSTKSKHSLRVHELESLGTIVESKLRKKTKVVDRKSNRLQLRKASNDLIGKTIIEQQSRETRRASDFDNNSKGENTDSSMNNEESSNENGEKHKNKISRKLHLKQKSVRKSLRQLPQSQKKAIINKGRNSPHRSLRLSNDASVAMVTDAFVDSEGTEKEQNTHEHSLRKRKMNKKHEADDNSQKSYHSIPKKKKLYADSDHLSQDSNIIEVTSQPKQCTTPNQDVRRLTRKSNFDSESTLKEKTKNATMTYSKMVPSLCGNKLKKEMILKEVTTKSTNLEEVKRTRRSSLSWIKNAVSSLIGRK